MLLAALRPGDIVLMDNLSSHKVAGLATAVSAVGVQVRYLPPYSPEFPPSNKTGLRRLAARTCEGLWALFGALID